MYPGPAGAGVPQDVGGGALSARSLLVRLAWKAGAAVAPAAVCEAVYFAPGLYCTCILKRLQLTLYIFGWRADGAGARR